MAILRKNIISSMYYGAPEVIIKRAKELRKNQTPAEKKIWDVLGAKRMLGLHFRRQHPIDWYIADFYCHTIRLVIEVDGPIHEEIERSEYDLNREAQLDRYDIQVIRFANQQVHDSFEEVKKIIELVCRDLIDKYKDETP